VGMAAQSLPLSDPFDTLVAVIAPPPPPVEEVFVVTYRPTTAINQWTPCC
jgi:hypothetical protein